MTEMKRISVAIPDALDNQIMAIRKQDKYIRLTYSGLIRQLLVDAVERERAAADMEEVRSRESI